MTDIMDGMIPLLESELKMTTVMISEEMLKQGTHGYSIFFEWMREFFPGISHTAVANMFTYAHKMGYVIV